MKLCGILGRLGRFCGLKRRGKKEKKKYEARGQKEKKREKREQRGEKREERENKEERREKRREEDVEGSRLFRWHLSAVP